MDIDVRLSIGLHDSRWGPNWYRTGRDEHLRAEIVRHWPSTISISSQLTSPYSEDEISPELRFTGAGILAMANSGPNTNGSSMPPYFSRLFISMSILLGSQFFITLGPTPYLDNKHTIFGRVSGGMRVVQRLGSVATDPQDKSVLSH